jgi:hypothetical protein
MLLIVQGEPHMEETKKTTEPQGKLDSQSTVEDIAILEEAVATSIGVPGTPK